MSAAVLDDRLPDSGPIHRLIRRTRRLLRSSWVATGAGLTIGLLLGALVVLAGLDLLAPVQPQDWTIFGVEVPIDGIVRLVALLLIVVPVTWALFAGVVRPLCRRLAATHVARRIEQHLPGIHNRLVSCIDLERKDRPPTSPVFHRRLLREALERIRAFRLRWVLDLGSLRTAAIAAFVTTLAFGGTYALASHQLPRAMARLFLPFADLPPVTAVAYDVRPGNADVLREEPIQFQVQVTTVADPADLRLELRGAPGSKAYSFGLQQDRRDPKVWRYEVDGGSLGEGYEHGLKYRVFGGGTWSKEQRIRLVDRPTIEGVSASVYYPDYMGNPGPQPPKDPKELLCPEGGSIEVVVAAKGDVASGEVQLLRRATQRIPEHRHKERAWFPASSSARGEQLRLPVGAQAELTWNWEEHQKQIVHTEPAALGTHRHLFHSDPTGFVVGTGDVLYAYVSIDSDPKNAPAEILLQWHDGKSWDHGAYWGPNVIAPKLKNGPAQRPMGPLPPAGRWVRLEVPARDVGLEGTTLRGMAFVLHNGRCLWGTTGSVKTEEPGVEVVQAFPITRRADGQWAGRFTVAREQLPEGMFPKGMFRPELKNSAGHPNKPREAIQYKALTDNPPSVEVQHQPPTLALSKPQAVPLEIDARDDFCLADIVLQVREKEDDPYREKVIHHLDQPKDRVHLVHSLAEAAALQPGKQLRFAVLARDRKGQTARTPEFIISVEANANAADTQLENYEKAQDQFTKRLVDLMAQQKKVQEQIEKANKDFAPVADKVQAAMDDADRAREKADPKKPPEPVKLDPEVAKKFAQLQAELAKLSQQQLQNANNAEQLNKDLAAAVESAKNLTLLPQEIAREMEATQQAFDQLISKAMNKLGQDMARDAAPNSPQAPNLPGMQQRGDRLQKDLEAMKERLDALSKARQGVRDRLQDALAELKRKLAEEEGKLTASDLEELKNFLNNLRDKMKDMARAQEELRKEMDDGKDLGDIKRKQEDLDRELENLLAQAKKLLNTKRKPKDRPEFPDSPYSPDRDTEKVPPKEEDSTDPLPGKKADKDRKDKKGDKDAKDKEDEEKEDFFMPALGGKKQEVDPRFDKKRRPMKRKPMPGEKPDPSEERDNERDHQRDNERDLDSAEKSLDADQKTLDDILKQLEQSLKNNSSKNSKSPQPSEADQAAEQLRNTLQSEAVRQAMEMASRMRQMAGQRPSQRSQQHNRSPEGNLHGATPERLPPADQKALDQFDAATQAMILRLPPRARADLLQGAKDEGPEGYKVFIENYFKRLGETKRP
jgi:hypothetical protein